LEVDGDGRDAESLAWVHGLQLSGPDGELALRRLHTELIGIARGELRRRSSRSGVVGPELDDLAHQAAADALVAITRKLSTFRFESRFTTWAYRFVILEVSNKLGRHFWTVPRVFLDQDSWERLPAVFGLDPERQAEWHELIEALQRAVRETLTPYQRRLFVAIVLNGVPLDALVIELGSSRNAIYKGLFDARRKLRAVLVAEGHLDGPRVIVR
jgi:RNA polymerase sigma-70 factor (ECF subfamily)